MSPRSLRWVLRAAIPAAVVCGLMAAGSHAPAQSLGPETPSLSCSNQTLIGDFGAQIEGTLLGPNFTVRGLLLMHFDGKGNLSAKSHVVVEGTPEDSGWLRNTGTYSVNRDCTGSAVISTAQPPIPFHFVIVKSGNKIHSVVDGNAITVVAYRVH